jgi:hypothetical protein
MSADHPFGAIDPAIARKEAIRLVDAALRGGISFQFGDDGWPVRWMPPPDIDSGPSEAWARLLVDFDRYSKAIRAELRRRLPRNGVILMGSPTLEADGSPLVTTREGFERAWRTRHDRSWITR